MDIKHKAIFNALLGFSIGLLIAAVITIGFSDYAVYSSRAAVLAQLIGSGINGAVCAGSAVIYDFEDWGITKATVTHFLITLISFFTASELLGWFPREILLITLIVFLLAYFIIWLINYLLWKKEVRQMNSQLQAMRSQTGE